MTPLLGGVALIVFSHTLKNMTKNTKTPNFACFSRFVKNRGGLPPREGGSKLSALVFYIELTPLLGLQTIFSASDAQKTSEKNTKTPFTRFLTFFSLIGTPKQCLGPQEWRQFDVEHQGREL